MSVSLVGIATSSSSSRSSSSSTVPFSAAGTSANASSIFPSFASSSMTASSANFQPSSSNESSLQNPDGSLRDRWDIVAIKALIGDRGPGKASLCEDVAIRIVDFLKPALFGAAEWQKFYGVDVGLEPELPEEFYAWWFSPDAFEPDKQNYNTHLSPVLRPRWVTETGAGGDKLLSCYSLNTLGRLIQHPKKGLPSKYSAYTTEALQQHGKTRAGPACWLVMRKKAYPRGSPSWLIRQACIEAGADYDERPSGLDLATVVLTTYVRTNGDRHLGDETGKEKRWTVIHCKERILSDPSSPRCMVVGDFSPDGLAISGCSHLSPISPCSLVPLRRF